LRQRSRRSGPGARLAPWPFSPGRRYRGIGPWQDLRVAALGRPPFGLACCLRASHQPRLRQALCECSNTLPERNPWTRCFHRYRVAWAFPGPAVQFRLDRTCGLLGGWGAEGIFPRRHPHCASRVSPWEPRRCQGARVLHAARPRGLYQVRFRCRLWARFCKACVWLGIRERRGEPPAMLLKRGAASAGHPLRRPGHREAPANLCMRYSS